MGPFSVVASIVCALVPLAIAIRWYRFSPAVAPEKPDQPWWRPEQSS
ncbi:MAG TPA: hypothetical protein VIC57_16790 [Candidatus Dormibacteraeota bacterium]